VSKKLEESRDSVEYEIHEKGNILNVLPGYLR